jgi:heat shock protein HtpX
MAMAKRIILFFAVNILVMITITTILRILGIEPYLTSSGLNYQSLAVFCLVWGFGGAFISLALSKVMAKFSMGVTVINPATARGAEMDLVQTVHRLAKSAGLSKMPEVGVYNSPEVNAFATGPTRNNSLVAVSTGLLQRMNRSEVEGVLAHEVAHIANGDMVTMTLIQGVINAFVMFFARVIAFAISNALRSNDDESPSTMLNFAITIVLEIILSLLGMIVVMAFSRWREYRADAGAAALGGRGNMVAALRALRNMTQMVDTSHQSVATLKIAGKTGGLMALFSSHPSLESRIERLERMTG